MQFSQCAPIVVLAVLTIASSTFVMRCAAEEQQQPSQQHQQQQQHQSSTITARRNDFRGSAVEQLPDSRRRSRVAREFLPAMTATTTNVANTAAAAAGSAADDSTGVTVNEQTTDADRFVPTERISGISGRSSSSGSSGAGADDDDDGDADTTTPDNVVPEVPARELGDLLHMDTKKFTEQQKQLFKTIVERVARVSNAAKEATEQYGIIGGGAADAGNIIPVNVEEGRDSKVRQTKVRLATTTVGGKPSTATTHKHSTATTTTVRGRPAVKPTAAPVADVGHSSTTVAAGEKNKYKLIVNSNLGRPASSAPTKTDNYTEVIFGNITTTSIVDSLSNDNSRETLLSKNGGPKRPASIAAVVPTVGAAGGAPMATAAATSAANDAAETKVRYL